MRPDLHLLLTERERNGGEVSFGDRRRARLFDFGEVDEVGRLEPMRMRYTGFSVKEKTDRLNPLRGWLRRQCGRRWDDAYAELCRRVDMRTMHGDHVRCHLFLLVDTRPRLTWTFTMQCPGPRNKPPCGEPLGFVSGNFTVCPRCGCLQQFRNQN